MGSCISSKSRPSSIMKKNKKPSNSRKRPSPLVACGSTFVYVPVAHVVSSKPEAPASAVIQRRAKSDYQIDFDRIYRKSDIIDKRLFLNSGFIATEAMFSPPVSSPSLLSPITPTDNLLRRLCIDATFTSEPFLPSPFPHISGPSPLFAGAHLTMCSNGSHTIRTARTTFISEDATVFSFDEETIREMSRLCSSSLQEREVIAML